MIECITMKQLWTLQLYYTVNVKEVNVVLQSISSLTAPLTPRSLGGSCMETLTSIKWTNTTTDCLTLLNVFSGPSLLTSDGRWSGQVLCMGSMHYDNRSLHYYPVHACMWYVRSSGWVIGCAVCRFCVCVHVSMWAWTKNELFERTIHFHGLL